jgi:hypothetical protein
LESNSSWIVSAGTFLGASLLLSQLLAAAPSLSLSCGLKKRLPSNRLFRQTASMDAEIDCTLQSNSR